MRRARRGGGTGRCQARNRLAAGLPRGPTLDDVDVVPAVVAAVVMVGPGPMVAARNGVAGGRNHWCSRSAAEAGIGCGGAAGGRRRLWRRCLWGLHSWSHDGQRVT